MAQLPPFDKEDMKRRMKGAVATLKHEFAGLRTGRANPAILEPVVDKAIRDGGLGLNPQLDGQLVRIPIPELNEERRRELAKLAAKYAEHARVAVRNVRRDGMDHLKRLEKEHAISEDQHRKLSDELQKMTDESVHEIDHTLAAKDQEIMHV